MYCSNFNPRPKPGVGNLLALVTGCARSLAGRFGPSLPAGLSSRAAARPVGGRLDRAVAFAGRAFDRPAARRAAVHPDRAAGFVGRASGSAGYSSLTPGFNEPHPTGGTLPPRICSGLWRLNRVHCRPKTSTAEVFLCALRRKNLDFEAIYCELVGVCATDVPAEPPIQPEAERRVPRGAAGQSRSVGREAHSGAGFASLSG